MASLAAIVDRYHDLKIWIISVIFESNECTRSLIEVNGLISLNSSVSGTQSRRLKLNGFEMDDFI